MKIKLPPLSDQTFWRYLIVLSLLLGFANWLFGEMDLRSIRRLEAAVAALENTNG